MTAKVTCTTWDNLPDSVKALRNQIFIKELGVPDVIEQDRLDQESMHFYISKNQQVLASGRLTLREHQAKIAHFCVNKNVRNKNIGGQLARVIIREAINKGATWIRLGANTQSQGFCAKFGFFPLGTTYTANNVEHIDMLNTSPTLILDTPLKSLNGHANFVLAKDANVHEVKDLNAFKQHVNALVPQARRQLFILSQSLEHAVFDSEILRNSVSSLARAHSITEVKFLVYDEKPLIQRQHQLIELMKRLPSHVQLKVVNREYQREEFGFVLVDTNGIIFLRDMKNYKGFANYDHAARVKQMKEKFIALWEFSRPSPEFRELKI